MVEAPDRLWIWFADREMAQPLHIRQWQSTPFGDGVEYLRAALSTAGAAEPVAWLTGENERLCDETAMRAWHQSFKRTDLCEKDRVRGALEAFKRQAVALQIIAESSSKMCERCLGNGEIVADWDRYLGPLLPASAGDEGVEPCRDCDGTGYVCVLASPPSDTEEKAPENPMENRAIR